MRGRRASLVAVACAVAAASSACATSPNGGTAAPTGTPLSWGLASSPAVPAGVSYVSLAGVVCPTSTGCWAVGVAQTTATSGEALIEQLTGAGWSIVATPTPAGVPYSTFEGVSCAGSGICWAVGYSTDAAGDASTLIEEEAGAGWTLVASPTQPAGEDAFLNGVACAGDDCWAAGSVHASGGESGTLIEQDTGSGWSIVPTPLAPSGVTSELDAVSCAGAGDCWASGDLVDSSGAIQVLIEQDAGGGWNVVPSPSAPDDQPSSLGALSCVSVRDCWAVGEFDDPGGTSHALLEHDGGSGWSIVAAPAGSGAGQLLSGVTCVAADDCWAVGRTVQANGHGAALIERFGGAGWSAVASPPGPASTSTQLSAVACASATECWAVGAGSGPALIEQGR